MEKRKKKGRIPTVVLEGREKVAHRLLSKVGEKKKERAFYGRTSRPRRKRKIEKRRAFSISTTLEERIERSSALLSPRGGKRRKGGGKELVLRHASGEKKRVRPPSLSGWRERREHARPRTGRRKEGKARNKKPSFPFENCCKSRARKKRRTKLVRALAERKGEKELIWNAFLPLLPNKKM